jgi:hypothetical protein
VPEQSRVRGVRGTLMVNRLNVRSATSRLLESRRWWDRSIIAVDGGGLRVICGMDMMYAAEPYNAVASLGSWDFNLRL